MKVLSKDLFFFLICLILAERVENTQITQLNQTCLLPCVVCHKRPGGHQATTAPTKRVHTEINTSILSHCILSVFFFHINIRMQLNQIFFIIQTFVLYTRMIKESLIQRKQKDIQIVFCSKCSSCHMPYSEFHLDKKAEKGRNST